MAASQAANVNWRTINIDALDPESAYNFDTSSLTPGLVPVSAAEVQSLGQQIRQLLRGGDAEGALRGAMEMAPYGGDGEAKVRLCIFLAWMTRKPLLGCGKVQPSSLESDGQAYHCRGERSLIRLLNVADTSTVLLQELHLATVVEILQSIKQADMSPMLSRIYSSPGGIEILDALMKYLFVLSPRPTS